MWEVTNRVGQVDALAINYVAHQKALATLYPTMTVAIIFLEAIVGSDTLTIFC
jgi:hypothetical protein